MITELEREIVGLKRVLHKLISQVERKCGKTDGDAVWQSIKKVIIYVTNETNEQLLNDMSRQIHLDDCSDMLETDVKENRKTDKVRSLNNTMKGTGESAGCLLEAKTE